MSKLTLVFANLKLTETTWRWLCALLLLALSAYAVPSATHSDFVQDYVAARGWIMGLDPNAPTDDLITACCPDVPRNELIPQTAHPPLATLLSLSLALLPWTTARWLLLLFSWILVSFTWTRLRTDPLICLLTTSLWVIGLSLGSFEALLFALVGIAVIDLERAPGRAGMALGLAVAIKAYPGALLLALVLTRRWKALGTALTVAAMATVAAELILGPGVTRDWLAYAQVNALAFADMPRNLSLVSLVHRIAPVATPGMIALALLVLLTAPLALFLHRGDPLRPMIPVMLLASPITWDNYLVFLCMVKLPRLVQALIWFGGGILLLIWLRFLPTENMAPISYSPLFAAMLFLWYRQVREGIAAVRAS